MSFLYEIRSTSEEPKGRRLIFVELEDLADAAWHGGAVVSTVASQKMFWEFELTG